MMKEILMKKWMSIALFAFGPLSLSFANDDICLEEQASADGKHRIMHEDPRQERGYKTGVQLNYSDGRMDDYEDPREDYEWPGMNDDSFYDFFTR